MFPSSNIMSFEKRSVGALSLDSATSFRFFAASFQRSIVASGKRLRSYFRISVTAPRCATGVDPASCHSWLA